MDEKQLQALANELVKNLPPEDPNQFDRLLEKMSVEAALNAEMPHHLGDDKNQPTLGANSRNGYSAKTVTTGDSPLEFSTRRQKAIYQVPTEACTFASACDSRDSIFHTRVCCQIYCLF